jgi:hypothetical protein
VLYWSRSGSYNDLLLGLALCVGWAVGGWLIVRSLLALKPRERWVIGIATGLLLFISLSDLLTPLLRVPGSFWVSSGLVLASGGLLALSRRHECRPLVEDLAGLPLVAGWLIITAVFTLSLRGLGLFDDYLHLPLVAVMARGDIPPHFYLDPKLHFAYHYGLHILAAAFVNVGGLFPWSAWDLSRGAAYGLAAVLAWAWMRRMTGSRLGAWVGAVLVSVAGGTRWLLLALPPAWLDRMAAALQLQPTALLAGSTFSQAMRGSLAFQGGGPTPFPFAFTNTNFAPLNYQLGSSGALSNATILVLLLLAGSRRLNLGSSALFGVLLGGLALSAEHAFVPLCIGLSVVSLVPGRQKPVVGTSSALPRHLWVILLVGILLALVQGGYITQAASVFFNVCLTALASVGLPIPGTSAFAVPSATGGHFLVGFGLRWPPALFSGHLGPLLLFLPGQATILLAELGPAIVLALPVSIYFFHRRRPRQWLLTSLAVAALTSLAIALFFRYGVDRQTTRLSGTALWIWVVVGFPLAWRWWQHRSFMPKVVGGLAYATTILGGIVLLVVELMAIPHPQLSYFIEYGDAKISRDYWDRIGPQDRVYDPVPERSVTLFGRPVYARTNVYIDAQTVLPEWRSLRIEPHDLLRAGYTYVYVDENWWRGLPPDSRAALEVPCVDEVDIVEFGDAGGMRRLLDLRACR